MIHKCVHEQAVHVEQEGGDAQSEHERVVELGRAPSSPVERKVENDQSLQRHQDENVHGCGTEHVAYVGHALAEQGVLVDKVEASRVRLGQVDPRAESEVHVVENEHTEVT